MQVSGRRYASAVVPPVMEPLKLI